jgi:hypothetical protein
MAAKEISVKKYVVRLSGEERERLETLLRKGKSPARRSRPSGTTTRGTILPRDGCADEFFREPRDRSAPPPEWSRIPPPRGPDR